MPPPERVLQGSGVRGTPDECGLNASSVGVLDILHLDDKTLCIPVKQKKSMDFESGGDHWRENCLLRGGHSASVVPICDKRNYGDGFLSEALFSERFWLYLCKGILR
jgi:hypothetical protein